MSRLEYIAFYIPIHFIIFNFQNEILKFKPILIMLKEQLNVLSQLASSDNEFTDEESRMLHHIGQANGMTKEEVDEIIYHPKPIGSLDNLTEDEKFEYLYNIVQLMKIDGQVYKSEIVFCQEMAAKLGFNKKVIGELSKSIFSDPSITTDRDSLRERVMKYKN